MAFELIVTEPFTRRLGDDGRVRVYKIGEHITDLEEIQALASEERPHHMIRLPIKAKIKPEAEPEPELEPTPAPKLPAPPALKSAAPATA